MPMLKTITGHSGCANIFKYLEDTALAEVRYIQRAYVGIDDPEIWGEEMDATREAAGHNAKWRGKESVSYRHFILSPDPLDKASADECMAYAKEWASKNFPGGQYVIYIHDHKGDAFKDIHSGHAHAHIVLNATNLDTFKKWHIDNKRVKTLAKSAQKIGERYGFSELPDLSGEQDLKDYDVQKEEPKQQAASKAHKRAAPLVKQEKLEVAEKAIQARGGQSWKAGIRNAVERSLMQSKDIEGLKSAMNAQGYDFYMTDRGITYVTPDNKKCKDSRLGGNYTLSRLKTSLAAVAATKEDIAREHQTDSAGAEKNDPFASKAHPTLPDYSLMAARERWAKTDIGRHAQRKLNATLSLRKEGVVHIAEVDTRIEELTAISETLQAENRELANKAAHLSLVAKLSEAYRLGEAHAETLSSLGADEQSNYIAENLQELKAAQEASEYFGEHSIGSTEIQESIDELAQIKEKMKTNELTRERVTRRAGRAAQAKTILTRRSGKIGDVATGTPNNSVQSAYERGNMHKGSHLQQSAPSRDSGIGR